MKVLFISHEASRTGAPLFLLHLCKYLQQRTNWELTFLFKSNGPLVKEFDKLGATIIYQRSLTSSPKVISKIGNRMARLNITKRLRRSFIKKQLSRLKLDLVYSNTATNGEILHELSFLKVKVVTHVHELENVLKSFGEKNLEYVKQYSSHYISASPSVTKYFGEYVTNNILEVNYFPIHTVATDINATALKRLLGLPDDAFVVGTAGTVEWRKGWDLFIRLAKDSELLNPQKSMFFVWVGKIDSRTQYKIEHELRLADLDKNVLFIGQKENPMQFFSLFDVFSLMSREEAFGIVAIESALYGIPVICFDNAEGLGNFIQDDAGYVIPYLDTFKMAEAIQYLHINDEVRTRMGEVARSRVMTNYAIGTQVEKIAAFLKSSVSSTETE